MHGEYKNAINLLYGIAFTIKMSYKGNHKIDGFCDTGHPEMGRLLKQAEGKEIRIFKYKIFY